MNIRAEFTAAKHEKGMVPARCSIRKPGVLNPQLGHAALLQKTHQARCGIVH
jgi:hypothetical protein